MCTLIGPEDQPHLTNLLNKPKTAHQLICCLKSVGSFFFPESDASRYSSVTKKRSAVEMEGYRSMALASSGYSFCWSHWNSAAPVGKVVVGVAESEQVINQKLTNDFVSEVNFTFFFFFFFHRNLGASMLGERRVTD